MNPVSPIAQGAVGSKDLPGLIFRLCAHRSRGQLEVIHCRQIFRVSFARGRINAIELPGPPTDHLLGTLLVRQGWLPQSAVEEAIARAHSSERLCGQLLVSTGLPTDALWATLKLQARRRFEVLIDRAFGTYRFHPDGHAPARGKLGAPLDGIGELRDAVLRGLRPGELPVWRARLCGRRIRLRPWALSCLWDADEPRTELFASLRSWQPFEQLPLSPPSRTAVEWLYFLHLVGALEIHAATDGRVPTGERPEPATSSLPSVGSKAPGQWSSVRELKRWWRAAARSCHPDLQPSADSATRRQLRDRFQALQEIYRQGLAELS